jgi:glycosyltransferase involved in cell wall biosynthesis
MLEEKSSKKRRLDIVIVHDYLIQMGGAEQLVASLHRLFPLAPIYTSVVDRSRLMPDFIDARIIDSAMRLLPGIARHFKKYFLLYPIAFQSLGKIPADLAIISSSGFSKWAQFADGCIRICYCHTPPRFFWSPDDYLENETSRSWLRSIVRRILLLLRQSDYRAAQSIDHFIANSQLVRERIQNCYGRDATVIYPPVDIDRFTPQASHDGYYLIVSRLVGYKRLDIVIRAFRENGRKLVVIGEGPDRERLQNLAAPNIEFRGWVARDEVVRAMQNAYALVFPGLEDFGITPIEANACGKPVLAFGAGGALETIVARQSGLFFEQQAPEAINGALPQFEAIAWDAVAIRRLAERFSEKRFQEEILRFVDDVRATGRGFAKTLAI